MTKTVRIENADTSPYKIVIEAQEKNADGEYKTINKSILRNPTDITAMTIWSSKRLVVREYDNELDKDLT